MYIVTDSATSNRRERKMRQTAASLTGASRRLTAERGLAGFTIEEVCDEVDVSRRTFFNYFASKEDAVIGTNPEDESRTFSNDFLARGAAGWPHLIDEVVELMIAHFEAGHVDPAAHRELMAALEREPRLLVRFIGITRDNERFLASLIAEREGVGADDPRVRATVGILSALMKSTAERLIDSSATDDFSTILRTSLAAFRAVLASPQPRKGTP